MTQPTIAVLWVPQLGPILTPDLEDYALAIAGMWAETDQYLEDPDNDVVAFQALFDVDIAPFKGLAWLAQCVGERLPVGVTDAQARDWIRSSPKWVRGTPGGIWNAVKRVLAPGAAMQMRERWNTNTGASDPDWISVLTWANQTPDPNLVLEVLRRNVPADIMYTYQSQEMTAWAAVTDGAKTWDEFQSAYGPRWADVAGATAGHDTWT